MYLNSHTLETAFPGTTFPGQNKTSNAEIKNSPLHFQFPLIAIPGRHSPFVKQEKKKQTLQEEGENGGKVRQGGFPCFLVSA